MRLTLFLNHRCNLRCGYCYNGRHFDRAMPLLVMEKAIELGLSLAGERPLELAFFGGEPLLELERMEAALAYAARRAEGKAIEPHVSTNATRLTDRALDLLCRHRFSVQVSIDGARPAQDAGRRFANGRSSFAKADRGVRRLAAEGLAVRTVSVIDPVNVAFLGESFDYLADLGVPHVYFAPNYLATWDDPAAEAFEAALRTLGDRLIARYRGGEALRVDPLHGKMVTHLVPGCGETAICPFAEKELAVSPSGRIYPCDRLVGEDLDPRMVIGHVDTGLDEKARARLLLSRRRGDPECTRCELRMRCTRFCGCANYQTTGDLAEVSPVFCWLERVSIAEADRVAGVLWAEQNPAFLKRFYGAP